MTFADKSLTILYFASLREQAGRECETLTTAATTLSAVYLELKRKYQFDLELHNLRPAVNHTFCDWQQPLQDGDTVAFIPPVSGG